MYPPQYSTKKLKAAVKRGKYLLRKSKAEKVQKKNEKVRSDRLICNPHFTIQQNFHRSMYKAGRKSGP